jgi:hypothetical protein
VARQRPPARRAIRRFSLASGPLLRASDRLEVVARVLVVAVLLTAVAVALAVATATYTHGQSEVVSQAADRRQVTALLLEDASAPASSGAVADVGRASAIWTTPSGAERSGPVLAPVGARAGSTVVIWVADDGDRTTRPLSPADVVSRAVVAGVLTYVLSSSLTVGGYLVLRCQLDRNRARRWETEWAEVEPLWTGKVP